MGKTISNHNPLAKVTEKRKNEMLQHWTDIFGVDVVKHEWNDVQPNNDELREVHYELFVIFKCIEAMRDMPDAYTQTVGIALAFYKAKYGEDATELLRKAKPEEGTK